MRIVLTERKHQILWKTLFSLLNLAKPFIIKRDSGFRIQDTGYRIQDIGCKIQGIGDRIQDTRYGVKETGYRIQDET